MQFQILNNQLRTSPIFITERDHEVKLNFPGNAGKRRSPVDSAKLAARQIAKAMRRAMKLQAVGCAWPRPCRERTRTATLSRTSATKCRVDFIEGDIDRPVVIAQIHNGSDLLPYSAGLDFDVNYAGYLSCIHNQNLKDGGTWRKTNSDYPIKK